VKNNSTVGLLLKKFLSNEILKISITFLNFFKQAAPIELISVEVARTVEKVLMLLFKLEILIEGPILRCLAEMNSFKAFASVGTPKGTSLPKAVSFDS
jgi:hypothetical protein